MSSTSSTLPSALTVYLTLTIASVPKPGINRPCTFTGIGASKTCEKLMLEKAGDSKRPAIINLPRIRMCPPSIISFVLCFYFYCDFIVIVFLSSLKQEKAGRLVSLDCSWKGCILILFSRGIDFISGIKKRRAIKPAVLIASELLARYRSA